MKFILIPVFAVFSVVFSPSTINVFAKTLAKANKFNASAANKIPEDNELAFIESNNGEEGLDNGNEEIGYNVNDSEFDSDEGENNSPFDSVNDDKKNVDDDNNRDSKFIEMNYDNQVEDAKSSLLELGVSKVGHARPSIRAKKVAKTPLLRRKANGDSRPIPKKRSAGGAAATRRRPSTRSGNNLSSTTTNKPIKPVASPGNTRTMGGRNAARIGRSQRNNGIRSANAAKSAGKKWTAGLRSKKKTDDTVTPTKLADTSATPSATDAPVAKKKSIIRRGLTAAAKGMGAATVSAAAGVGAKTLIGDEPLEGVLPNGLFRSKKNNESADVDEEDYAEDVDSDDSMPKMASSTARPRGKLSRRRGDEYDVLDEDADPDTYDSGTMNRPQRKNAKNSIVLPATGDLYDDEPNNRNSKKQFVSEGPGSDPTLTDRDFEEAMKLLDKETNKYKNKVEDGNDIDETSTGDELFEDIKSDYDVVKQMNQNHEDEVALAMPPPVLGLRKAINNNNNITPRYATSSSNNRSHHRIPEQTTDTNYNPNINFIERSHSDANKTKRKHAKKDYRQDMFDNSVFNTSSTNDEGSVFDGLDTFDEENDFDDSIVESPKSTNIKGEYIDESDYKDYMDDILYGVDVPEKSFMDDIDDRGSLDLLDDNVNKNSRKYKFDNLDPEQESENDLMLAGYDDNDGDDPFYEEESEAENEGDKDWVDVNDEDLDDDIDKTPSEDNAIRKDEKNVDESTHNEPGGEYVNPDHNMDDDINNEENESPEDEGDKDWVDVNDEDLDDDIDKTPSEDNAIRKDEKNVDESTHNEPGGEYVNPDHNMDDDINNEENESPEDEGDKDWVDVNDEDLDDDIDSPPTHELPEDASMDAMMHLEDEDDEDHGENEDADINEEINDVESPSGLEYLGAGYDLLKGNPMGDTIILLDPGYRASVVQMHWRDDAEGLSNSRHFIQPKGAWVRPYTSCHKGETISEVAKTQSLDNVLSADASVSASLPGDKFKFAASVNYNNIKKAYDSKGVNTYVSRSYCFNFVAGIPMSIKWDTTQAFQAALKGLPKTFQEEGNGLVCHPYDYLVHPRSQACKELGVTAWMQFFTVFGTHVTTKVYLGGKMLTIIETKSSQEADLKKKGIDVKAELSVQAEVATVDASVNASTSSLHNRDAESLDTKKSMFVIGGDIYGDGNTIVFNDWAATVPENSMPIKAEYTPLAMIMGHEYMKAYNDAYLFYGKVSVGAV